MKKVLIICSLIVSVAAFSQASSSSVSRSRETSTTTVSTDDVNSRSSITRSSESYDFDAKFDKKKYEEVKELIIDQLGTNNLQVKGKTYFWNQEKSGREYFSCKLTNNELNLTLNLEVASSGFADDIDELGGDLRDVIQKHKAHTWTPMTPATPQNPNSTDPQLIENELAQAELELELARKRVERLKKKKDY
ncbi:MAG: hypothetical protein AB8B73_01620 [Ekhidna sp.]